MTVTPPTTVTIAARRMPLSPLPSTPRHQRLSWSRVRSAAPWLAALMTSALILLAGCSTGVRMGYNQAETLVSWRLSDYVDFEPHQRELFGQKFRAIHDWHRREQLPEYAQLLRELRERTAAGLNRDDLRWMTERSRARLMALVDHAADDAATVLVSLTSGQVEALEKAFARANRRLARSWRVGQPIDEQKQARAESLIRQAERFTGRLTGPQRAKIAALADALPMTTEQRFAERQRRQAELVAALRSGRSRAELASWFRQWATNWERDRDSEYARVAAAAAEQRLQIFTDIDRMLTPAQRRTALDRLQGYIDDIVVLSGAPAPRQQRAHSQ